ncbi:hypothetical protein BB560_004237 [Smittium megazygosporum]|uniref:Retrotransposon gag domain-containing protein n=1 Tax=Smittium megazygosporum TaxID=133381 RepID=A0A2T9Z9R8_9FUNG|nr:hypothetical protein BB560_004237 [Smittium megazygosporum]
MGENQNMSASFVEGMGLNNELRLPGINKFDGTASTWFGKLILGNSSVLNNFELFSFLFAQNFSDPTFAVKAQTRLEICRQYTCFIIVYATEFRSIARDTNFDQAALKFFFLKGLRPSFERNLYSVDLPDDLEGIVTACAKVENIIAELEAIQFSAHNSFKSPSSQPSHYQNQSQNAPKDPDVMGVDSITQAILQPTAKSVLSQKKRNLNTRQEVSVGGATSDIYDTASEGLPEIIDNQNQSKKALTDAILFRDSSELENSQSTDPLLPLIC